MTKADIQHFLIVYDIPSGKAQVRDFGTDYETALEAYAQIEGEMCERDDLDIVLVGADSLRPSSGRTQATSATRRRRLSRCCRPAFSLAEQALASRCPRVRILA